MFILHFDYLNIHCKTTNHNKILKEFSDNLDKNKIIKILKYNKFADFYNDFLKSRFMESIENDPLIQGNLQDLDQHLQIVLNSFDVNYSAVSKFGFWQKINPFNNINRNSNIRITGIGNNIYNFIHQRRKKIIEIWKRVYELLNEFNKNYFQLYSLQKQKELLHISIDIHEYIVEKMEFLYKVGKIDSNQLISEQNDLAFKRIQLSDIEKEIEITIQKSSIEGFDIKNPEIFKLSKFVKSYIYISYKFLSELDLLFLLNNNGYVYTSPKDISEAMQHKKQTLIPLDIKFESQSENFKVIEKIQSTLSLSLSFNQLIQQMYNFATDRISYILKEINIKGKANHQNTLESLNILQVNTVLLNNTQITYIENLKKELFKFEVDPSNILQIVKYIDHNMIKILNNKHKNYGQLYQKHFELMIIMISIILTYNLLHQNKQILDIKSHKDDEEFDLSFINPFLFNDQKS